MNKRKLFYGSIFLLLGTVAVIYAGAFFHCILSKQTITFDFFACISILRANPSALKVTGCLELILIMLVVLSGVGKFNEFRTDVMRVTDSIETPTVAGHNEHGSARWMTDNEKDKYFGTAIVKNEMETKKWLDKIWTKAKTIWKNW